MRKKQVSLTAAGIAVVRAVESEKPAGECICYDPYARQFIPAWMYHLFGFFIKAGYTERRGPGVNGFLVARERYIDEVLWGFLAEGLQQLVILGAGFDSRLYRFDIPTELRAFEVDHPVTQAYKVARLQSIFGAIPSHVSYIPADFNTQTLSGCLLPAGYDPNLKTLVIWQGISMYLSQEAVDATLDFVVNHSRPGSAIVFDYIYQAVLEGVQKHFEVRGMRRYHFMTGERLTYGIPEGEAKSFLKARGFRQVTDVGVADLKTAYFNGVNAGRAVTGGYGIALAIV